MTRTLDAEIVIPAQCELAEGPVWDAGRGLLRWVDILPGHVHSLDPATGAHTRFEAGEPVGTVGIAPVKQVHIESGKQQFADEGAVRLQIE